ncbi:hypothetical protein C8J57DRAFT_1338010 [Mycena rebaudengoi]|nr:hypothetical protein C8J57DRAFT_1338010 [Mycena rebaudengoi]
MPEDGGIRTPARPNDSPTNDSVQNLKAHALTPPNPRTFLDLHMKLLRADSLNVNSQQFVDLLSVIPMPKPENTAHCEEKFEPSTQTLTCVKFGESIAARRIHFHIQPFCEDLGLGLGSENRTHDSFILNTTIFVVRNVPYLDKRYKHLIKLHSFCQIW